MKKKLITLKPSEGKPSEELAGEIMGVAESKGKREGETVLEYFERMKREGTKVEQKQKNTDTEGDTPYIKIKNIFLGIIVIVVVSFFLTLFTEALFDKFGWWRRMAYYSDYDLFNVVFGIWTVVLFFTKKTILDSKTWSDGKDVLQAFGMGFWIVFGITLLFDIHFERLGLVFDDYVERGIFSAFIGVVVGLFLLKKLKN